MARKPAIIISDKDLISGVLSYLAEHKGATRADLRKNLNTSQQRLQKLESQGHFKLPALMSKSKAATKGRFMRNTMLNWYIGKPSAWQRGYSSE